MPPENISIERTNVIRGAFNTNAMKLPDDNWTPLRISLPGEQPRNVDWSFRGLDAGHPGKFDPYDAKIRFNGTDGRQHEIVYQPQGRTQPFDMVNHQNYQFAAVSYDGVYREPVSGRLLNVDGNTPSSMPRAEFEAGFSQANAMFNALAATTEFREPKISASAIDNPYATPYLAGNTYAYREVTPAPRVAAAMAP